jgi:hypothetical protein
MSDLTKILKSLPYDTEVPLDAKEVDTSGTKQLFANKERMRQYGPNLYGNFNNTPEVGCTYQYTGYIPLAKIVRIAELRPCDNGGELMEIEVVP